MKGLGLSNELMQLRKICQHPYLFESVEDKISPSGYVDDKLIRTSGKIELLNRVLPKFFATGHRVTISSIPLVRPVLMFHSGSDFLPNDKGHGHHGRLLEDTELEVPPFGWWHQDRRACFFRTTFQCRRLRVQGLHPVN